MSLTFPGSKVLFDTNIFIYSVPETFRESISISKRYSLLATENANNIKKDENADG